MPKIIENVREQLLEVAKKQVAERGYGKTTIRSVAGECGLAVGTVYNYFKSKDMLIASFMAEDWKACLKEMEEGPRDDARGFIFNIYSSLCTYSEKHSALFSDADAAKVFSAVFSRRHKQLRDQIAELILPICGADDFLSRFIAESLICWTMAGEKFDDIYRVIEKLIKQ